MRRPQLAAIARNMIQATCRGSARGSGTAPSDPTARIRDSGRRRDRAVSTPALHPRRLVALTPACAPAALATGVLGLMRTIRLVDPTRQRIYWIQD